MTEQAKVENSSANAVTLAKLDDLQAQDLALFCWQDRRPLAGAIGYFDWRLSGALSRTIISGHFNGKAGERLLMPTRGRMGVRHLYLFGLGPYSKSVDSTILSAIASTLGEAKVREIILVLPFFEGVQGDAAAFEKGFRAATQGKSKILQVLAS